MALDLSPLLLGTWDQAKRHVADNFDQVQTVYNALVSSLGPAQAAWTPSFQGSGNPGAHTYSTRRGHYTKIGKIVVCSYAIILTAKDGAISGTFLQLGGLPFPAATAAAGQFWGNAVAYFANLGAHTGLVTQRQTVQPTAAFIVDSAMAFLAPADLTNTSALIGSLYYEID